MGSLGEALPEEQARVRALIIEYRALPQNAGMLAAMMMEQALQEADQAIINGDVVAMIRVYKNLKEFE